MPLNATLERELIHTRTLEMTAHRRADELYDIEGHLVDRKPFRYDMPDHSVAANTPVHDMWLRLTVDRDGEVKAADALMDVGPHFTCTGVLPNYQRLVGLRLGAGWNRAVRERLGNIEGCTHLSEMLAQMATTALQALWAEHESTVLAAGKTPALDPKVLNACHSYREDSEYVREYFPDSYEAPKA